MKSLLGMKELGAKHVLALFNYFIWVLFFTFMHLDHIGFVMLSP